MIRWFRMATVFVGTVFAASASAPQELLRNPSFEELSDNGVPVGWQRYGGGVPESVLEPAEEAHGGARSIRLRDTGPNERDGRWSVGVHQDVPVKPGDKLIASIWVKALARNHEQAVALQLTFLPVNKSFPTYVAPLLDGQWHRIRNYAEAPPGSEAVRVYIYTMHYWTSETLVDDASLRLADPQEFGDMIPLAAWSTDGPSKAREVRRLWPIVAEGKPVCAIVMPDLDGYRDAGRNLAAAIGRWATALPEVVLVPLPGPELRGWKECPLNALTTRAPTIIAIGNLNNNPVAAHMSFNRCAFEDSLFPGPGAYALRTVADPYLFPPDSAVIVVGCSDALGAQAGVEALVAKLKEAAGADQANVSLPWTQIVSNAQPLTDAQRDALRSQPLVGEFVEFNRFAEQYFRTGEMAYAEAAKRALLACWERYKKDPRREVTWPEETSSNLIGSLWAAIEPCPVFSDEDRLTIARTLLVCLYSLPRHCSYWGRLADNDTIIWNHTTFPLLGIYWLTRYFQRAYPDLDADRMEMMMREVRGAFRGQLHCWKPQCDADSYLTIVPRHTIEYTLAENDFTWFANGSVRTFAEYLSTLADPRGTLPGLGDSSYATSPGYELNGLPIAFWYYQDPRFLWRLNQISQGGRWPNPYHQHVEPQAWTEWAGVTVFPLHEHVYRYTIDRGYYDEGPAPPNVPLEQAFDKIAFRESLEPDGQYLLLDGYSRGKHLHWDGNAIIKFYHAGQDWLIDGDYLVRNTTEHSMVSVLHDGRCDQLPPPCAALEAQAVFERAAMTQTVLREYNGTNWRRNIFWDRGNWFVVIDEIEARQAGEYTMDVVWKTLREGTQELTDGRVFKTSRRSGPRVGSYGLITVADPAPDVSSAVRFIQEDSQLDFPIELPAGKYVMTTWAYGLDTGTDSFWVQIDGGERVAFHIPIGRFGPSSDSYTKHTPTPNITIPDSGRHRITISLRENAGVMLDRITFHDAEGKLVREVQAESAPPLPPEELSPGPSLDFYIVSDGSVAAKFVDRESNVGLKIRKLWQRKSAHLEGGETMAVANLLYDDTSAAPLGLNLRPISPKAALVVGPGGAEVLVGVGGLETPESLQTDARMFMFTPTAVRLVDCTRLGPSWNVVAPVSFEIDLTSRRVSPARGVITAMVFPEGEFAAIERAVRQMLDSLAGEYYGSPRAPASVALPATETHPTWRTQPLADGAVRVLRQHQAGGEAAVVAAVGPRAICLSTAGSALWQFEARGTVNDVWVADLDRPDKTLYAEGPEVLVASDDENLYILSAAGNKLRELHIDYPLRVGRSSIRQPRVSNVLAAQLTRDGDPQIIVGTLNGNLARLTADLEKLWVCDEIEHGTRELQLADLDSDGVQEILAANKYGAVEILRADGEELPNVYSELGDVEFAVGDIDSDGRPEIVNGSSTGALCCAKSQGKVLWRFNNHGYAAYDVEIAQIGGDWRVLVASETGYVYALDNQGRVVKQVFLGPAVRRIAFLPNQGQVAQIVVGCDGGEVYFLAQDLTPTSVARLDARITALLGMKDGVVAGLADGSVALIRS